MKSRKTLASAVVLLLPLVLLACDSGQSGPTAPSSSQSPAGPSGSRFGAIADPGLPQDVVSLKVTAPAPISPDDGVTIEEPALELRIASPQATYVQDPVAVDLRIEIWTIPPGATPVYTIVVPAGGATTASHTTPETVLQDETLYVWRARAELDGAAGPWSETYSFLTQFVKIEVPEPTDPINGKVVTSLRPVFTVINPAITGDPGPVLIEVEISTNANFTGIVETGRVEMRDRGETNVPLQNDLQEDRKFYWRARGTNEPLSVTAVLPGAATVAQVTSDWSSTQDFRTPEASEAVASVTSGGGGGGGGGSACTGCSVGAPFTTGGGNPPNMLGIIQQVADQNPGALASSCQEHGGNWEFMDLVVERLRSIDGRWGYNCKRGNCGDVSLDVIDYYRGSGSPNGSTDVAIIDIIGGHCGSSPRPAWIDQTGPTQQAGSVGRWKYPR